MKLQESDESFSLKLTRGEAAALAGAAKVVLNRSDSNVARAVHGNTLDYMQSGLDLLRDFIRAIDHGDPCDDEVYKAAEKVVRAYDNGHGTISSTQDPLEELAGAISAAEAIRGGKV